MSIKKPVYLPKQIIKHLYANHKKCEPEMHGYVALAMALFEYGTGPVNVKAYVKQLVKMKKLPEPYFGFTAFTGSFMYHLDQHHMYLWGHPYRPGDYLFGFKKPNGTVIPMFDAMDITQEGCRQWRLLTEKAIFPETGFNITAKMLQEAGYEKKYGKTADEWAKIPPNARRSLGRSRGIAKR